MEMKVPGPGEVGPGASGGCNNRPPSRIQRRAPTSLHLHQAAGAGPAAWGSGTIPLLSPLIVSPAAPPVWEADQGGAGAGAGRERGDQAEARSGGEQPRAAARHCGVGERQVQDAPLKLPAPALAPGAGWRHPALPAPVAEPASLVPFFQSQCAVELRNAPQ